MATLPPDIQENIWMAYFKKRSPGEIVRIVREYSLAMPKEAEEMKWTMREAAHRVLRTKSPLPWHPSKPVFAEVPQFSFFDYCRDVGHETRDCWGLAGPYDYAFDYVLVQGDIDDNSLTLRHLSDRQYPDWAEIRNIWPAIGSAKEPGVGKTRVAPESTVLWRCGCVTLRYNVLGPRGSFFVVQGYEAKPGRLPQPSDLFTLHDLTARAVDFYNRPFSPDEVKVIQKSLRTKKVQTYWPYPSQSLPPLDRIPRFYFSLFSAMHRAKKSLDERPYARIHFVYSHDITAGIQYEWISCRIEFLFLL
jgi:hypothetical protein